MHTSAKYEADVIREGTETDLTTNRVKGKKGGRSFRLSENIGSVTECML